MSAHMASRRFAEPGDALSEVRRFSRGPVREAGSLLLHRYLAVRSALGNLPTPMRPGRSGDSVLSRTAGNDFQAST